MWQINMLRHITELYGETLGVIEVRFDEFIDKCIADEMDDSDYEELYMLEELGRDIERVLDKLAYIRDLYTD